MSATRNILIVEDDPHVMNAIQQSLVNELSHIVGVGDGLAGLAEVRRQKYDLIILDISLPGMNGFDLCRAIRLENHAVPILMLTSRVEELDKVLGLELGADDYVTKPFGTRELAARCRALLRRSCAAAFLADGDRVPASDIIEIGHIRMDLASRQLIVKGELVPVTATEFDLLALLAANPGRTFSRENILERVWGYDSSSYGASVTVLLSRIRSKVEPNPETPVYIMTVRRVGYRFATLEELAAAGVRSPG